MVMTENKATVIVDDRLKTATYNIHHGSGNDDVVDLDRIAEVIADTEAHVVALQENDIVNGRTDFVNQPQVIAENVSELTGEEWVALEAPAIEFSGGEYGNAILYNEAALNLTQFENVLLPGNPAGDGQRSAGIASFQVDDTDFDFQFVATHFTNLNEATEDGSTIQLDSLNTIDDAVALNLPVILAGDLNADSNPVLSNGELVENNPETIEELQNLGYEIVSPADDDSDTVPSEDFDGVIDYIALKNGEDFEVEDSEIIINGLTDVASDHYPVTTTFNISSSAPTPRDEALPFTHAHNDYEHQYPLLDALSYGFVSVEADIWLYPDDNDNLRVAHDPVENPAALPTLEELYLDPLQELKEEYDNGGVYADGTPLNLLIDIKSEGLPTYQRLDEVLAEYNEESPGLFTTYTQDESGDYTVEPGAVTPIISGDRPLEYMQSQEVRYAGYDGRKDDIGAGFDSGFMPLISDNWDNFFTDDLAWDGTGEIPEDTEAELNEIVSEVQEEDKIFRFWNLPQDAPSVWEPLYEAGVDLINTDNLEGLSSFIESQQTGDRDSEAPIVIGHRGASGELPPHTLEAYKLAIEQGADFIEPDLVITKDGELVARHDPNLIFSTDVRYHPEFADRLDTEIVGDDRGGVPQDGYFVKDFTLEEVKTLGAIQDQAFRDQSYNGQFEIATLDEIIDLVQEVEEETGREIGIYPEIKHSEYFNAAGLDIEQALVDTFLEQDFTNPEQIYVQSFQVESLIKLNELVAGTPLEDTPMVQLYGDPTAQPHDIVKNFSNPDFDPTTVYGTEAIDAETTYGDLINLDEDPNVNLLADFVTTYAEAIGPNEDWVYVTEELAEPVDADGDGIAQVTQQLTGEVLPVIDDAHEAGLDVHIWTFRNEERYLLLDEEGNVESPEEALERVIESGADGFFTDFPATGAKVRDRFIEKAEAEDEPVDQIIEIWEDATIDYASVVAHRGGYYEDGVTTLPENSLATIEQAIDLGVEMVELDFWKTADDRYVIIHDETVDRTTTGTGRVEDLTLEELKELNLIIEDTGEVTSEKIPTLEEAFVAIDGEIMMNVDIKLPVEELVNVMNIARELGVDDQIVIKNPVNNEEQLAAVQDTLNQLPFDVRFMPIIDDAEVTDPEFVERVFEEFQPDAAEMLVRPQGEEEEPVEDPGFLFSEEVKEIASEYDVRLWINTLFANPEIEDNGFINGFRNDVLALTDPDAVFGYWVDAGASILQTDEPVLAVDYLESNDLRELPVAINPVFGSLDADILEVEGSNNIVFAGEGDDSIDASLAEGNNRIYGDGGDDTFILGTSDLIVGGEGADKFFATSGGDNILTGGAGADQFWIANAELPETANVITDFMTGDDALIGTNGRDLAILSGIAADSLTAENFVLV